MARLRNGDSEARTIFIADFWAETNIAFAASTSLAGVPSGTHGSNRRGEWAVAEQKAFNRKEREGGAKGAKD
jgi:hypothetical protein